ncbi:PLP-dependent aminotransferase family protein [Streptomyces sp. NBS 14/10]|uniref:aminotransferase-like domain-containing protein n=1 Tax=Streptomyces sp. NBS 14/10 TaxID=1945643 RepID=UPI000B9CCB11|nr:PLP-dependent aminotransferase family protein [Streptomyces sp. NBS 14/10]KAK1178170.1 PLP-dependent aminotransferase family protein [Streptomyces sp. NBS 14/10]
MPMDPADLADRLGRWSAGRGPLYLLLAARLRRLVDEGELHPGTRLPPDRALASALAVGRGTVVAAYEQLRTEGRIVRRQGSGTRVAGPSRPGPQETTGAPVFLHLLEPQADDVILLACAAPAEPPPILLTAYERALSQLATVTGDIGYHPSGHPHLRRAVADHYTRRGVPTDPERVLVTNGGQQALSLLARAFVEPGGPVLVEAPTYPGALEAFHERAAALRTLPTGLDGFEAAVRTPSRRPELAYLVSTHHNPTGSVLPPLARRRLAVAAATADVPLIDDEVLAHLGFPGRRTPPPLAMYSDTVITVGSLSKSVWGGLRIGWIRATRPVIDRLARLRAVHDLGGNFPAQLAAAELLPRLETLCQDMAADRRARHDHLRAELARHLPQWQAPPVTGGQTLWVRLPHGDGDSFAQTALRHGVAVLPGSGLDASGGSREFIRIHFLATPDVLTEAVRRLATAWQAYGGGHDRGDPAPAPRSMAV